MVCSYSKEQLKELGDALKRDPNSHETTSTGALVIGGTPAEATLTKIGMKQEHVYILTKSKN